MAFTKINAAGIGTTETVTVDGLTVINNGSFGGNLTVSGVLTYEDVTNVDSVGLITARNGIVVGSGITLSKDGDIFATGITTVSGNVKVGTGITLSPDGDVFATGVVTATSFKGDGSNLTGLSGVSVANQADNRVITNTGTTDALNAEANLTFNGTELKIGGDSNVSGTWGLEVYNTTGTVGTAVFAGTGGAEIKLQDTVSGETIKIAANGQASFYSQKAGDPMVFFTKPSGGSDTERVRIDSDGRLLAGTATSKSAGSGQYAKLNIEGGTGTTENFVSFSRAEAASAMSANDEVANLTFNDSAGYEFARIQVLADAATGATDTPGRIVFKTTADGASSSTERLRIDSSGIVESNSSFSATYSSTGSITPHLRTRNPNGTDNIYGGIQLRADRGTGAASIFNIACLNTSTNFESVLIFQSRNTDGNFTEKMRITGNGDVLIGTDSYAYTKPLNVQGSSGAILSIANYDTTSYAANTHTGIEMRLNTGNTGNQNGSCEIRAFKENGTNGDNSRALSFYTAGNGASPAERLRIASDGFVTFNNDPDTGIKNTNTNTLQVHTNDTLCTEFSANQRVRMPQVYSTAGSSMRDVQIESDGTLAALSSITAAKINIADVTDVSWLYNLKAKTFNFRKKTVDAVTGVNTYLNEAEDEKVYGLLAEDVETINKDFCFYDKDSEGNDVLAGVYYKTMVVPLLKAVQDLKSEIDTLKTKVAALEG